VRIGNGTAATLKSAGPASRSSLPASSGAGVTWFFHADHLGTPKVRTTHMGAVAETWDYYPFGETWVSGLPGDQHRYTGHLRDAESNNDYAGARYYSNARGRWLSVDPAASRMNNPQVLNRYSYVRNDPVNLTDPDGRLPIPISCSKVVISSEGFFMWTPLNETCSEAMEEENGVWITGSLGQPSQDEELNPLIGWEQFAFTSRQWDNVKSLKGRELANQLKGGIGEVRNRLRSRSARDALRRGLHFDRPFACVMEFFKNGRINGTPVSIVFVDALKTAEWNKNSMMIEIGNGWEWNDVSGEFSYGNYLGAMWTPAHLMLHEVIHACDQGQIGLGPIAEESIDRIVSSFFGE